MQVRHKLSEETAKEIIWLFDELLYKHNIKIDNEDLEENQFGKESECINEKECNELKEKIKSQLSDCFDCIEDVIMSAA